MTLVLLPWAAAAQAGFSLVLVLFVRMDVLGLIFLLTLSPIV